MIGKDSEQYVSRGSKIFLLQNFISKYPHAEIWDIYSWLWYGEFGVVDTSSSVTSILKLPLLQTYLDYIDNEKSFTEFPTDVWEPLGMSHKFILVYITNYYNLGYPLKRLINLHERSVAFSGSKMQFKLDWNLAKDTVNIMIPELQKDAFYKFEDENNFHTIPDPEWSLSFKEKNPYYFTIVSQKLFFDYFPEFEDTKRLDPPKAHSNSIG